MISTILGIILKITGVILLILWILFTQWGVRRANWKENMSMQRWFMVVAFLAVFGIYTQFYMFFLAYPFKDKKFRPFSWWLDDSRYNKDRTSGLSLDFEIYLDGRKETFWVSYWWHMRNMIWNLQNKFRVRPQTIKKGNQNIYIVRNIKDTIRKIEGTKLDVDGLYGQFAGLKYWKNGVSTWQTMNGEKISLEKSIIGIGHYFYKNGDQEDKNQLNWTFTSCKLVNTWFLGRTWRTIQIGMKQRGYSRQFKYQKDIELK